MSFIQFAVMALVAAMVTIPTVLVIPRARQSPAFDRMLWAGTLVIAFLGGWAALGYASPGSVLASISGMLVADVPVLVVLAGAVAGAVFLNAVLWLMDRMGQEPVEETGEYDELEQEPGQDESQTPFPTNTSPAEEPSEKQTEP